MITLVAEVALSIFKSYKMLRNVAKLKDRLRQELGADVNLEDNLLQIEDIMGEIASRIHSRLLDMIRTESNPSILSLAQLTMTTTIIRWIILNAGPFEQDTEVELDHTMSAMTTTARLVFTGFTTETKRRDILEWAVSWFKHQMDIDYHKMHKTTNDIDAVGQAGLQYVLKVNYLTIVMSAPFSAIVNSSINSLSIGFPPQH
jgi:hypothetical protein